MDFNYQKGVPHSLLIISGGVFVLGLKESRTEQLTLEEQLFSAHKHVMFHHYEADGYIAIAKREKNRFSQYHYKPEALADALTNWLGEDVYFSQNTFYKPTRTIESIRELRSLYVDIDTYNMNFDNEWVLGKIQLEVFGDGLLPEPNIIIRSGRGLVCIWLLEPVPHMALPLWTAVQNFFCNKLKYVGADTKALDASRIFRVSGSINSKSNKVVEANIVHNYRYSLREVQEEYLPDLTERKKKTKKRGRPKKIKQLFNIHSLHYARLLDIVKLVELRKFDVVGHRELLCFLYRYWSCCFIDDKGEALDQTLNLNSTFNHPLAEREVVQATSSAEKAYDAKSNEKSNEIAIKQGYPGAGYNLRNTKIIEWLEITEEEQSHLKTIIGRSEKYKRNNIRREKERRANGQISRDKYLKQQKKQTAEKLSQLQEAIKQHPNATRKELSTLLNVSPPRITQLRKLLIKKG